MEPIGLAILAILLAAYSFSSKRLAASGLTGPMLFMIFGLAAGPRGLEWVDPERAADLLTFVLEATLVVVLFTDAFEIELGRVGDEARLPGRLLGIGLPLTILIGWGVAAWMFPQLQGAPALLLAIALAPTDAALGQAVVSNPRVPERIRHALNFESGLNDGLVIPLFFVVVELAGTGEVSRRVIVAIVTEVGVAALIGVALGTLAAVVGVKSGERGWTDARWVQIALVSVALAAWGLADWLGGSGFIAAWVAGMSCGVAARRRLSRPVEFSGDLGNVLTLVSFAVFGASILGPNLSEFDLPVVLYAVLSLVAIRGVSVILATTGADLQWPTRAYLGWFGPRGLASIILVLVVATEAEVPGTGVITVVAAATVGLSVLLHGATAWWGSNRYADWSNRSGHT